MSLLNKMAPKKFLCKYPLQLGAKVVGIIMCIIMSICVICTAVQVIMMSNKDCDCPETEYVSTAAYGFSCAAVLYCIFMLVASVWFLWGVKKGKASVVIGYFVVAIMWLAQTFGLLVILISLYSAKANFIAWLLALIFGILAIAILIYLLLVIFGYWLELKQKSPA